VQALIETLGFRHSGYIIIHESGYRYRPLCVVKVSLQDAATLPQGHVLIEPYLYDMTTQGQYDSSGTRHSTAHASYFGSLTYMNYGLANRFTVGLIPTFGYNEVSNGPGSAGVGAGDLTTQAQYRFTQFREGTWVPTTSVAAQETLPSGKYDRLGDRLSGGFGAGSYTTTVAFYSQTYFWLPNGRILRMRFNVWPAFSRSVKIEDVRSTVPKQAFAGMPNPVAHSSSMRPRNTALRGAGCWPSRPRTVTRATLL